MNFTVISDTHNEHNQLSLNSGDILIHCGDACIKGNYTEGLNFLYWMVKQPFKYKILVPGNHDAALKTHSELIQLSRDLGIKTLLNEYVEIEGIKFWGGTFTPRVKNSKFINPLTERIESWSKMPLENIDVLITHTPPHSILDTNKRGEHCGCDVLLDKVKDLCPKYHLFGHIHEHGGQSMYAYGTKFFNCSNMNPEYIMSYLPKIINYGSGNE